MDNTIETPLDFDEVMARIDGGRQQVDDICKTLD